MDEMLKGSLETYNEYVGNLPNASYHIANLIKEEGLLAAINLIRQFSEGMSWVIDMNTLLVNSKVAQALDIPQLQEFLAEITNAFEMQDYVLLADLFEYEIAPFFEAYNAEQISN